MLIYSGTKQQFDQDVLNDSIAHKIDYQFRIRGLSHENVSEFVSWENSLKKMQSVLADPDFGSDINIAVEYQIPMTSKRVDFLIAGTNYQDEENVVIVELKQWEEAGKTSRDGIVTAYTGRMVRAVTHPSYQAYSYAKTIENFNATVQDENISLYPCAYLHNYKKSKLDEIVSPLYQEVINLAPLYIKSEEVKLRNFIKKYVTKSSKSNLLFKIENGKIRPSKALQDTLASMLNGNEEFVMIDEQKVVFETVKRLVEKAMKNNVKYTVIVEGGPGSGKSVVAIQLLTEFITKRHLNVNYITKNAAPRNVYFEKLKQGNFKLNYVKFLFKGSGSYVDSSKNEFDCLITDEAHRLNAKSGMFKNKGENQIKEIINASRVSVFFIDEDQVVTASDIGSISEIKKWAKYCGSTLYYNEETKLASQFRCNGSDGYIAFINDLLGIKKTANYDGFDIDYDLILYDSPEKMREDLREKNNINNKSRMIAGYCYEWRTKNSNDLAVYDIELDNGFKARWNFSNTITWAIDEDSFD
ncbi:ATP/GTP binding protein [Desulfosporosinus sp. BG]|nr:ATP/GTP binding protein [Desulfosporosinus sp. BG]